MPIWLQTTVTIVVAVFASTGFWSWVQKLGERKDARTKMLLGLAHDRILSLCEEYLKRGYVSRAEYENLDKYLYKPYIELGGNGTVKHIKAQVDTLPSVKEESK